jgi:hypothetical protein
LEHAEVSAKRKGLKAYAVTSSIDGFDRGGSSAVAGEQFHTDGGIDQINFERRRGDRHSFVAVEHFWTVSLSVADARWNLNSPEWVTAKVAAARQPAVGQRNNFRARRKERRRAD